MTQNMDILIVEPGKAPRPAVIPNTLESVETVLGGAVQVGCFLPQKVLLISREDTAGLAPNRCLPGKKGISAAHSCCAAYRRKAAALLPSLPDSRRNFMTSLQGRGNL